MSGAESQVDAAPAAKRRGRWPWVLAVAVAMLYLASAFFYNRSLPVDLGSMTVEPASDGIGVYVAMGDVKSSTDRIGADLLITFGSELTECNPICGLSKDLALLVSPSTKSKIELPRGTPAGFAIPIELFLEGTPYTYPFDSYVSRMFIQAVSTAQDGSALAVPLVTEILVPDGFAGWRIQLGYPALEGAVDPGAFLQADVESELSADSDPYPHVMNGGQTWAYMSIERALSTQIIALLVLTLMVILAVLAVVASRDVQTGRRSSEGLGMAGWLTGSLFAMPALRALLPGSPPLGSWIDILVFFWVEIATMIALATFVIFWLRQSPAKE
jgi:hypothetical protein